MAASFLVLFVTVLLLLCSSRCAVVPRNKEGNQLRGKESPYIECVMIANPPWRLMVPKEGKRCLFHFPKKKVSSFPSRAGVVTL